MHGEMPEDCCSVGREELVPLRSGVLGAGRASGLSRSGGPAPAMTWQRSAPEPKRRQLAGGPCCRHILTGGSSSSSSAYGRLVCLRRTTSSSSGQTRTSSPSSTRAAVRHVGGDGAPCSALMELRTVGSARTSVNAKQKANMNVGPLEWAKLGATSSVASMRSDPLLSFGAICCSQPARPSGQQALEASRSMEWNEPQALPALVLPWSTSPCNGVIAANDLVVCCSPRAKN